jgi:hypothetical protein
MGFYVWELVSGAKLVKSFEVVVVAGLRCE